MMIEIVVWFNGLHPTLKFVGLAMLKVGQADKEFTVTCLVD